MNPQDTRPDDRETLSALFDGELDAEARLFALRRLGHDAAWQRSCGQWQLIGDALRRQAPIAAPADFAARVGAAVAAEAALTVAPVSTSRPAAVARGRNWRWVGGGALAASIALAVTVSTLPFGAAPVRDAGTTVATATPSPAAQAPTIASAPAAATGIEAPVAAPTTAIDVPARVEPAVTAATQAPRVASATPRSRRPAVVAVARTGGAGDASEVALLVGQTGNPFNLDADEALTARPWPRAALTGNAFTARYGAAGESAGKRPSFYPFEPRPQGEPEPAQTP